MKIFITGATGFVGQGLTRRLTQAGHEVSAWVRDPERASQTLGPNVRVVATAGGATAMAAAVAEADAVVNLAGEPVIGGRWTAKRREVLRASRVGLTEQLVDAMIQHPRPRVFVSASAVGYYGDTGASAVDEDSPPGTDFLAELCRDWEAAAMRAETSQTRVCVLRLGLVLGRDGGVLARMLPVFRWGLGGRLGSGEQFFPWIHYDDVMGLLLAALAEDATWWGPVNAVAPGIVQLGEFTSALGKALGRPAVLPVPAFVLRLALGEAANAVLWGQRVIPKRALAHGYAFRFPQLDAALADLLRVV